MEIALQILINSLVSGLLLSLVAIGATYIFRVTGVFHLAHGGIYSAGAFVCWWVLAKTDSWPVAIVSAVLIAGIVVYLVEKSIYLPLTKRQSAQNVSLVSSMGVYVVLVNTLALLFGNENKTFQRVISGVFAYHNIILSKIQLLQIVAATISVSTFYCYLKYTRSDLSLRAISDNTTISKVFGINTNRERLKVFVSGSVLVAIAAILKGLETGIDPQSGLSITLTASVVAILVSRLNVILILVFSFALTILQSCIEWFLNAQWKDGITFLILLLVILYKTEGIVSYNLRKDKS